jgi:hypothetical protein
LLALYRRGRMAKLYGCDLKALLACRSVEQQRLFDTK